MLIVTLSVIEVAKPLIIPLLTKGHLYTVFLQRAWQELRPPYFYSAGTEDSIRLSRLKVPKIIKSQAFFSLFVKQVKAFLNID